MSHLRIIAENAYRLWEDAKLLFDARRYPSSLALSVLSLEESGKYYILKHRQEDNSVSNGLEVTSHVKKQQAASWFHVETIIGNFFSVLEDFGYEHKPYRELTNAQRKWYRSAEGQEFNAQLRRGEFPPGALEATIERTKADGTGQDYEDVASGELNRLKQRGLYVDLEGGNVVKGIPQRMGEVQARKWLKRAEAMAKRALADAKDQHQSEAWVTVLRDSLIRKSESDMIKRHK